MQEGKFLIMFGNNNSFLTKMQLTLCLVVGTILITFLYVFKFFGPSYLTLPFIFLLSLFFFMNNINKCRVIFFLHAKMIICLISLSIVLAIMDFIFNWNGQHFNDLIRILIYFVYFSWAGLLLSHTGKYRYYYDKLALASLVILIILGGWEFIAPTTFNNNLLDVYSEGISAGRLLVSGPIRDSNTYSGMIVILFFLWSKVVKKDRCSTGVQILLFMLVASLVTFSGSRLGAIMFILSSISIVYDNIRYGTNVSRLLIIASLIVCFGVVCFNFGKIITVFEESSVVTVYTRVFGAASGNALLSNHARIDSLWNALDFSQSYYYLWGPGMINFTSAWSNGVLPHNLFMFIYAQYGLFCMAILYLLWVAWRRAVVAKEKRLFLLLMLFSNLLVNALYYPIFYFVLLYIDLKYAEVKSIQYN